MPRLSKWTVEALLLSDDLAKLIEANRIAENGHSPANKVDGHSAEGDTPRKKEVMPLYATAKEPAPQVEAGSYTVTCMEIKEDTIENSQFNPDVYRLSLETEDVLTPEGNPVRLDAICSRTLSPKSKLWRWLTAFGIQPEVGKRVDLEDVVERQALAIVINKESEGGVFSRVDDIVPMPGKRTTTKAVEDIGDWWGKTRNAGLERMDVMAKSEELFGKAPAELTPDERADLSKALGV